jgi:putative sterol carrier protein
MSTEENRAIILDGIFGQREEHFDADGAKGTDAVLDWKIFDRPEGGYDHWRIEIADGKCRAHDEPDDRPARVTFRAKPVDFLKPVTGSASGPQMFITGKLKIEGDLTLAARVQGFFQVPRRRLSPQRPATLR